MPAEITALPVAHNVDVTGHSMYLKPGGGFSIVTGHRIPEDGLLMAFDYF